MKYLIFKLIFLVLLIIAIPLRELANGKKLISSALWHQDEDCNQYLTWNVVCLKKTIMLKSVAKWSNLKYKQKPQEETTSSVITRALMLG